MMIKIKTKLNKNNKINNRYNKVMKILISFQAIGVNNQWFK